MKTIGMLGGMSWESSLVYYRHINQKVKERLGGLHSAKCLMYSVDFQEVEELQHRGDWEKAAAMMIAAARSIENGGADFLIICTNTMHKVADAVQAQIRIPLLHIADPTADEVKAQGIQRIALLGTRFTMQEDFYKGRLIRDHGLDVILPADAEMDVIHEVIYNELCLGVIDSRSKARYLQVVDGLMQKGAQGVILGCTEIGLLIRPGDRQIPFFDTTEIHAEAAVAYALAL